MHFPWTGQTAFMILHLTNRTKAWASAEWGQGSSICDSFTNFQAALTKPFDPVTSNREQRFFFPKLDENKIWEKWKVKGHSIFTNVILHQLDREVGRECDVCGLEDEDLLHMYVKCTKLSFLICWNGWYGTTGILGSWFFCLVSGRRAKWKIQSCADFS